MVEIFSANFSDNCSEADSGRPWGSRGKLKTVQAFYNSVHIKLQTPSYLGLSRSGFSDMYFLLLLTNVEIRLDFGSLKREG